ncbi:malate dehydrogenase [Candidatus Bathycorpusculum sp.]|uniref:malate dehydrogenase n=1 Tax=Candidatus Bathycorpusculum sp. TaxID=2994959 RepID=UPI0028280507|nr:malate dehydrogenase [Candidatus Termitimicrobium sp.]MCL2685984.1 malate dehydrogenase [Candidatus Termitimicrobium sp.]
MITVIGAGRVGSAAAFEILRYKIDDVVLIDTNANQAKGEALDMMQASPAIEFDGTIEGTSDFSQMRDSELIIITAGAARKPGMNRIDLMKTNAQIMRSITKEITKYASDAKLLIVTNPVDIMTYISFKETNFPRNHVFGMGNILDTMRFRNYIARELGVSREDTRALVIGEHGDSMVPLVEYATVSGIPITNLLTAQQIEQVLQKTINSGGNVIKLKGGTQFAPSTVIALMSDAIITGRNRVMSVSTWLQGEYGYSNLTIGVPVVLGKNGIEKIIELQLSNLSQEKFEKSINTIKTAITHLNNN